MTGIRLTITRIILAAALAAILAVPIGAAATRHAAPAATVAQIGTIFFDECEGNAYG